MGVRRVDVPNHARFLTFSCFKRLPLFDDLLTRDRYVEEIGTQSVRLGFGVLAFVVMPEHVHLVVVPKDGKVAPVLRALKQGFARRELARLRDTQDPVLCGLVGPTGVPVFWQRGGGYDRVVRGDDDLREKIGYIHENPVRRGLVARAEDWVWSSVRVYAGVDGVGWVDRAWLV